MILWMEDARYVMLKRPHRSAFNAVKKFVQAVFGPSWAYARPAVTADLARSCKRTGIMNVWKVKVCLRIH